MTTAQVVLFPLITNMQILCNIATDIICLEIYLQLLEFM